MNKHNALAQSELIDEHSDHVEMQFLTMHGQLKYIAAVMVCGGFLGGIFYLWAFV